MKKIRFLPLVLCACLAVAAQPSYAAEKNASTENNAAMNQNISVPELKSLLAVHADLYLLDVRQPEEFAQGHIEGATLIPLNELETRLAELPKNKRIVAYCRSGHRSGQALTLLQKHGFSNAQSLSGGFIAWSK